MSCALVDSAKREPAFDDVFVPATREREGFRFDGGTFSVSAVTGSGVLAKVHDARYAVGGRRGACTVKVLSRKKKSSEAALLCETLVLYKLFCTRCGCVPEPLFAAHANGMMYLGMSKLETTLADRLRDATEATRLALFKDVLAQIAPALHQLQTSLAFMHGDLHTENVMFTGRKAFLIDFSDSSLQLFGRRRFCVRWYEKTRLNPCLDLLMLVESCAETVGYKRDPLFHRLMMSINGALWNRVESAKASGGCKTERAIAECKISRAVANAKPSRLFHAFYEHAIDVSYKPTRPLELLSYVRRQASDARGAWRPPSEVSGMYVDGTGVLRYSPHDKKNRGTTDMARRKWL